MLRKDMIDERSAHSLVTMFWNIATE